MIERISKNQLIRLSDHFRSHEFECRCNYQECRFTAIDTGLIEALELLRDVVGPLRVSSGYRCSRHNDDTGGKAGSYHLIGKAADVFSVTVPAKAIAKAAMGIPSFRNGGIGQYPGFVHLDVRGHKSRWGIRLAAA